MARNREATERRLVAAVGGVLEAEGAGALGASAIAHRAGVDKALIYKYFGGLDALCRRYAESADLWWSADELLAGLSNGAQTIDRKDVFSLLLVRFANALRRRPATLAILADEARQNSILSEILAEARERETKRLFGGLARIGGRPPSAADLVGLTTLMSAVTYVTLLSRRPGRTVYGVELGTEDPAWTKIEAGIVSAARAQFGAH